MNKDQVKGRTKAVDGKAEELIGKVIDDKKMKRKGKAKEVAGKAQAGYGDLKDDLERKT